MATRDYYKVLGIATNVSDNEIKKAYRKLAMKYHPDRNPDSKDAEARFKEVGEAYDMLSDLHKRAAYDQFGHAGVDPNMAGPAQQDFVGFAAAFGDAFGDIFGRASGGGTAGRGATSGWDGRRDAQAYRGADLHYRTEISLEHAAHGYNIVIRVPGWVNCAICRGSGANPGTRPQACPTCHGQGTVRMSQGFFGIQQTCPNCRGTGTYMSEPCGHCHGAGKVKETKTLEVKIPAGIDEGTRIRLSGRGAPGINGVPSGDLYIVIHIKPHPVFERKGNDLHCQMPIPFPTAALGGEIEVPTLAGRASFTVPEGAQSGRTFRLRSKGIKGLHARVAGDLYVHVRVETPVKLTEQQYDLLRRFERSLTQGRDCHSPLSKRWSDRVKSLMD